MEDAKRGKSGFGVEEDKLELTLKLGPPGVEEPSAPSSSGCPPLSQPRNTPNPVVGWPADRSFRKSLAGTSSKPPVMEPENSGTENATKPEIRNKGHFVKINMDGIPIGRKVDLKAYNSYEKLSSVVSELFQGLLAAQKDPAIVGAQCSTPQKEPFTGLLDGRGEYILVYEDNEGDIMQVGNVPWDWEQRARKEQ